MKLHIPSFSVFQYAPVALCIPLLPLLATGAGVVAEASDSELSGFVPVDRVDGTCSIMVEVTANLYGDWAGVEVEGDVALISEASIEFFGFCQHHLSDSVT